MGRGEWLGEGLRLRGQGTDDRPLYTTDGSADGRIDWTHGADTRTGTYLGHPQYRLEPRRRRSSAIEKPPGGAVSCGREAGGLNPKSRA